MILFFVGPVVHVQQLLVLPQRRRWSRGVSSGYAKVGVGVGGEVGVGVGTDPLVPHFESATFRGSSPEEDPSFFLWQQSFETWSLCELKIRPPFSQLFFNLNEM